MWLRTEIELTVSGQSREEELGWILPQDWKLSLVDSPIPVAVDDRGRMKAQVRAGKWTIRVDAFRYRRISRRFRYGSEAVPIVDRELIGFQGGARFPHGGTRGHASGGRDADDVSRQLARSARVSVGDRIPRSGWSRRCAAWGCSDPRGCASSASSGWTRMAEA